MRRKTNMKDDKLHNITSTGFKIPKAYFESFDDQLFAHLDKNDSIEGVKTAGYAVPKDYFSSIEDNILAQLRSEDKSVISLKSRKVIFYMAGIAASLVLLFAVFIRSGKPEYTISAEMVEAYLEDRDLNSYELAQLLSDSNLLEDDFTIIKTTYEEDNLESYLLEHSDIESIIEY